MNHQEYSRFCYTALLEMTRRYNDLVDAVNRTYGLELKHMPKDFPEPPK